jgi:hypothetical protein
MLESIPGLLLAATIALTLILLPLLNEERRGERSGATEELHVRQHAKPPTPTTGDQPRR